MLKNNEINEILMANQLYSAYWTKSIFLYCSVFINCLLKKYYSKENARID
jgi:hypothetical protein